MISPRLTFPGLLRYHGSVPPSGGAARLSSVWTPAISMPCSCAWTSGALQIIEYAGEPCLSKRADGGGTSLADAGTTVATGRSRGVSPGLHQRTLSYAPDTCCLL